MSEMQRNMWTQYNCRLFDFLRVKLDFSEIEVLLVCFFPSNHRGKGFLTLKLKQENKR